jgi:hypothetical protein
MRDESIQLKRAANHEQAAAIVSCAPKMLATKTPSLPMPNERTSSEPLSYKNHGQFRVSQNRPYTSIPLHQHANNLICVHINWSNFYKCIVRHAWYFLDLVGRKPSLFDSPFLAKSEPISAETFSRLGCWTAIRWARRGCWHFRCDRWSCCGLLTRCTCYIILAAPESSGRLTSRRRRGGADWLCVGHLSSRGLVLAAKPAWGLASRC